jgi:hypothetical protein
MRTFCYAEFAPFVRDKRGLGVGVVPSLVDQVPAQHGELAAGRDDGDLHAAAGLYLLVERPQRPAPRSTSTRLVSTSIPRACDGPALVDAHVTGWLPSGLANPRVEPELGEMSAPTPTMTP